MAPEEPRGRRRTGLRANPEDRIGAASADGKRRRVQSDDALSSSLGRDDDDLSRAMPDSLGLFGVRLERILAALKNPLAVAGLIVIIAGTIIVRSISPDQIAIQIAIGAIGVDFLVFGLAFNTISSIRADSRPRYVITLFSIFSIVTLAIFSIAVYLLISSKPVLVYVPPISPSAKGTLLPVPSETLKPDILDQSSIEPVDLMRREGSMETEFLPMGWREGYPPAKREKPRYVANHKSSGLSLLTGGFVWSHDGAKGRFAAVAGGSSAFIVNKMYVKLHKYVKCDLRNERWSVQAPVSIPGYAFYISDQANIYELVPRNGIGQDGHWKIEPGSYDEFQIRFQYDPYVLYLVTIELSARRLSDNAVTNLSSGVLPLLRVANGNDGGCLDLAKWYNINNLRPPVERAYSSFADALDSYQILTLDTRSDRVWLSKVVSEMQPAALDDLSARVDKVSASSKSNDVFAENAKWLREMVSWRKSASGTEPP